MHTNLASAVLLIALAAPVVAEAPVRIVCLGDSVTKAIRPGVKPEETYSAYLERNLTRSGLKATVINSGIGGHTTADGLARFDRDVLAHQPAYVVIMFGLNDSWIDQGKTSSRLTAANYKENLKRMTAMLKERQIQPLLMTANPVAAPMYPPARNVTLKKYVEAVRAVAREERLPLVDVYARFAELAVEGVDLNTLFTDAMHPNPKGQALIADWLAEEIRGLRKR